MQKFHFYKELNKIIKSKLLMKIKKYNKRKKKIKINNLYLNKMKLKIVKKLVKFQILPIHHLSFHSTPVQ